MPKDDATGEASTQKLYERCTKGKEGILIPHEDELSQLQKPSRGKAQARKRPKDDNSIKAANKKRQKLAHETTGISNLTESGERLITISRRMTVASEYIHDLALSNPPGILSREVLRALSGVIVNSVVESHFSEDDLRQHLGQFRDEKYQANIVSSTHVAHTLPIQLTSISRKCSTCDIIFRGGSKILRRRNSSVNTTRKRMHNCYAT